MQGQFDTIPLLRFLCKACAPLSAGAIALATLLCVLWACCYIGLLALRALAAIVTEAMRLYLAQPSLIQLVLLCLVCCGALWLFARLVRFARGQVRLLAGR